jgi:hypothetical protein
MSGAISLERTPFKNMLKNMLTSIKALLMLRAHTHIGFSISVGYQAFCLLMPAQMDIICHVLANNIEVDGGTAAVK